MEGESSNISDSRFKSVLGEHNNHCTKNNDEFLYKQLFQKKLTPNDVANKRFVIPRKYATKYFPHIQHNEEMDFYDTSKNLWRFRFFYCQSSEKCIFTKGWYKFVKDKGLRARDIVIFNLCECKKGTNENCNTFVIDVVKNVEALPMDHDVAALKPVLLFGKQIGWTEIKKENEV